MTAATTTTTTICHQAEETLKAFEKKDSRVKSAAATNLSFLYYLVRSSN